MKNKKGISLIVLIITIIIMIILASAVILTINNTNIFDRAKDAVDATTEAEIKNLAVLGWSDAYLKGKAKTDEEFETAIRQYIINAGIKEAELDSYLIVASKSGVEVYNWPNVATVVNGVPIPKGFVVSPYTDEDSVDEGLVIYELGTNETSIPSTETQATSWISRNQYVWVPVDTNNFVRQKFGMGSISDTIGSSDTWEVSPTTTLNSTYMTPYTLTEVQEMYKSVKEYGGFYIARYEAGLDDANIRTSASTPIVKTLTNVHSKMNKLPYINIMWSSSTTMNVETGGAVEVARSLYPNDSTNTTGVISTLTYGVQWDSVMSWWDRTDAVASLTDSSSYGNCASTKIELSNLNTGARYSDDYGVSFDTVTGNNSNDYWLLTTGALKTAKVKNIYDMAGNAGEWSMEGKGTSYRIIRGSWYTWYCVDGDSDSSSVISNYEAREATWAFSASFRPSLYIKI